jgi:membrane fusion protein, multidrug efflux system
MKLDGLQPGDRIAVAGVSFLREGMRVRDLGNALEGSQP